MRFLLGFIFGAAASRCYWNNRDEFHDQMRRRRLHFREESTESPNEKKYELENEDYRVIFNMMQKNPQKAKIEELNMN